MSVAAEKSWLTGSSQVVTSPARFLGYSTVGAGVFFTLMAFQATGSMSSTYSGDVPKDSTGNEVQDDSHDMAEDALSWVMQIILVLAAASMILSAYKTGQAKDKNSARTWRNLTFFNGGLFFGSLIGMAEIQDHGAADDHSDESTILAGIAALLMFAGFAVLIRQSLKGIDEEYGAQAAEEREREAQEFEFQTGKFVSRVAMNAAIGASGSLWACLLVNAFCFAHSDAIAYENNHAGGKGHHSAGWWQQNGVSCEATILHVMTALYVLMALVALYRAGHEYAKEKYDGHAVGGQVAMGTLALVGVTVNETVLVPQVNEMHDWSDAHLAEDGGGLIAGVAIFTMVWMMLILAAYAYADTPENAGIRKWVEATLEDAGSTVSGWLDQASQLMADVMPEAVGYAKVQKV